MKLLRIACLALLLQTPSTEAAEAIKFAVDSGSMVISIEGERIAKFTWQDAEICRPYFSDICTLDGQQVTRRHPPDPERDVADHPTYHPGIWLTFGDINGSDYWRLKAPTKFVEGSLQVESGRDNGSFRAQFHYLKKAESQEVVCKEHLHCRFVSAEDGYFLLWDSTFSHDQPFAFGDQEEMGLGFRVDTMLRAETKSRGQIGPGTGIILDSEGRENGKEVWGNSSSWCDYSGQLEGKHVGITLMCHPDNFRPSWFHARDYGLLVANPFGRAAFRQGEPSRLEVNPGETLRLRFGIYVHGADNDTSVDLPAAYQEYLRLTKEN